MSSSTATSSDSSSNSSSDSSDNEAPALVRPAAAPAASSPFGGAAVAEYERLPRHPVASGVLMWIVVLMVVLASVTSNGPGEPIVDVSGPAAQSLAK